jgi:DeoR/GlpR family transcriptional regulator of sugar metabolism
MKLAVAAASTHTVLAVDSGKLGRRSAVRGLALDQIDLLVTELDPAHELLDPFRDHVDVL